MYENVEIRKVFAEELEKLIEKDERIVVLDADLASSNGTRPLEDKYPDRVFNMGIAEQNMTAFAAGMSTYGFIPFIGSFAAFATRRACDQIAISLNYAKTNVKIVGSDPGITAEINGGTHAAFEDIGVIRSLPNMVIFEPVDAMQLAKAMPKIVEYNGPVYIRMFRKVQPVIFKEDYEFDLFKADTLKEGKDVTIFATGIMINEALEAEKILKAEGIDAEIINIHTIKPIDREAVVKSAKKTGAVVTCENHNVIGGLNSAVAEVLVAEYPVPVRAVGIQDEFGEVGKLDYLKERFGLTKEKIVQAVKEVLEKK